MKDVIITCPYCGAENHLFPPRIKEIGDFNCIRCGQLLPPTLYNKEMPEKQQNNNEKIE